MGRPKEREVLRMRSRSRAVARRIAEAATMMAVCASGAAGAEEIGGSVTLYGWLPWIDGEITSRTGDRSVTTGLSAGDVLGALDFAFMAAGEIGYGRISLLQDVVYADLGASGRLSGPFASRANVGLSMLISTTALGYRVYDRGGIMVQPFAGLRYVSIDTDVRVTGGGPLGLGREASVDLDWVDPVIGVRGRASVTDRLSVNGFVDIGGFGAGSEFSWEAFAGLDYALTDTISAAAGFRYLLIDYEADRADLDLDTWGPVLGLTLRF